MPAQTEGEAPAAPIQDRPLPLPSGWRCGASGGVLAVVQRELVEEEALAHARAVPRDWAVAESCQANVVNLSMMMIGGRHFRLAGAMAALGGMLLAPLLVVLLLAALLGGVEGSPAVQRGLARHGRSDGAGLDGRQRPQAATRAAQQ